MIRTQQLDRKYKNERMYSIPVNVFRFINSPGEGGEDNVQIQWNKGTSSFEIVAKKDILDGVELLLKYEHDLVDLDEPIQPYQKLNEKNDELDDEENDEIEDEENERNQENP